MAYNDLIKDKNIDKIILPETIVPVPTQLDYDNGYMIRYFIQKANDYNGHIFELNNSVYTTYLNNAYWKGVELKWRIAGPKEVVYKNDGTTDDIGLINSNKASIGLASVRLKNIGLYLPNLLQFHK